MIGARRKRVMALSNVGFTFEAIAKAVSAQFGLEGYDKRRAHRDWVAGLETYQDLVVESGELGQHAGTLHERRLRAMEREAHSVYNAAMAAGDGWLALSATQLMLDVERARIHGGDRLDRRPLHPDPARRRRVGLQGVRGD